MRCKSPRFAVKGALGLVLSTSTMSNSLNLLNLLERDPSVLENVASVWYQLLCYNGTYEVL